MAIVVPKASRLQAAALLVSGGIGAMGALAGSANADIAATFWSPSRNIRCVAERNPQPPIDWGISCQVVSARKQFFMNARGAVQRAPYSPFDTSVLSFRVLPYGASLTTGPFQCTSRTDGVRCTNRSGSGWFLSRERQTTHGPARP